MTIALTVTGHRPPQLGGYNQAVEDRVYKLAYDELKRVRPDLVLTGMALGWDQACAQAAFDLKIAFHAYVPFIGQEKAWPRDSRLRYHQLLEKAVRKVVVCEGDYAAWKMGKRNERMVDDGEAVLALWNGTGGGTAHCVMYAQRKGRRVHNCWDKYVGNVLAKQREMAL